MGKFDCIYLIWYLGGLLGGFLNGRGRKAADMRFSLGYDWFLKTIKLTATI
jgi:hypothetical protein